MHQTEETNLAPIIALLRDILNAKGPLNNLAEIKSLYPSLAPVLEDLMKLREFSHALSAGDLQQPLDMRGYCAGSLKALQSNLRHLTWQTSMVATGDYSQRVDFMGDFSVSFNSMIHKLKEAAEQERKYKLLAENTEDVIWLLDAEMRLQYISPSISRLMGFTQENLEGRLLADLPLPFIHAAFPDGTAGAFSCGDDLSSRTVELHQPGASGKMIWTETSITAASNVNDKHLQFLGATRNISERKIAEGLLQQAYERKYRNDFFNRILVGRAMEFAEIQSLAAQNKLWVPENFSLYFLNTATFSDAEQSMPESALPDKAQLTNALIDYLNRKDSLIAWELIDTGIGLIETRTPPPDKQTEIAAAQAHLDYLSAYLPGQVFQLGIADYAAGWRDFASRLDHARTAAKVGAGISLHQPICHYDDCGIFPALAPFAATPESMQYIKNTLGPLIEYDDRRGTELVATLEKLLTGLSWTEIATELFCHHKTIQLRKHRIEQLLHVSLDNHETRLTLSAAMQLRKLIK